MNLEYSLRGQPMGAVNIPFEGPSTNLVFFCQDCGQTWGQIKTPGSHTWRQVYRPCGCKKEPFYSSFEVGLFEHTPYGKNPIDYRNWMSKFERWPKELLQYELLQLLDNLESRTYWDSLQ